ncbi:hypothetical protein [Burkholderia sp. WAC0059]|uniref:hypothetical protein n=1 Tax=Burkholderia sp. WAC0059 TaxID=2066022 RepID=UPI0011AEEF54|nr:hypothetical protein [Burkholderia sp. WAC0059]
MNTSDCSASRSPADEACAAKRRRSAKRLIVVALFGAALAGCSTLSPAQSAQSAQSVRPAPSAQAAGGERTTAAVRQTDQRVDYAGQPCGDPNLHVHMPTCLFPR